MDGAGGKCSMDDCKAKSDIFPLGLDSSQKFHISFTGLGESAIQ